MIMLNIIYIKFVFIIEKNFRKKNIDELIVCKFYDECNVVVFRWLILLFILLILG